VTLERGVGERRGAEEDVVEDGERESGGADADGLGEEREGGVGNGLGERADGVAEIAEDELVAPGFFSGLQRADGEEGAAADFGEVGWRGGLLRW